MEGKQQNEILPLQNTNYKCFRRKTIKIGIQRERNLKVVKWSKRPKGENE